MEGQIALNAPAKIESARKSAAAVRFLARLPEAPG
jgi:hypothetical protein